MLADRGHNDTCPLSIRFLHQYPGHNPSILLIQMADRFIQKNKIKRLAKGADQRNTLQKIEGEEEVEKMDALLSLAITGGDFDWI